MVKRGGDTPGAGPNAATATSRRVTKWSTFIILPKKVGRKIGTKPKPTKLRSSLTPGTVVIILSGRFRGKRAIFLKQLASGLLLVTGPYSVNGVPLRRVNQRYVIATKTKVDLAGSLDDAAISKFNDEYFAKPKGLRKKDKSKTKEEGEESIFMSQGKETQKPALAEHRKQDQVATDEKLQKAVSKDPLLAQYLKTRFTLRNLQYPHRMVF